jgi:hypothetical protein
MVIEKSFLILSSKSGIFLKNSDIIIKKVEQIFLLYFLHLYQQQVYSIIPS